MLFFAVLFAGRFASRLFVTGNPFIPRVSIVGEKGRRGRAGKFSNSGGSSRACVSIFNARQPRWKGALWKVPFVACIVPCLPRLLILHFSTIIWFTASYRNCATVEPSLYNSGVEVCLLPEFVRLSSSLSLKIKFNPMCLRALKNEISKKLELLRFKRIFLSQWMFRTESSNRSDEILS